MGPTGENWASVGGNESLAIDVHYLLTALYRTTFSLSPRVYMTYEYMFTLYKLIIFFWPISLLQQML